MCLASNVFRYGAAGTSKESLKLLAIEILSLMAKKLQMISDADTPGRKFSTQSGK